MRQWSKYQEAVFDCVKNRDDNIVVRAVAGSGKTTTIHHALNLASGKIVTCAFNKSTANALRDRIPEHVDARTLNSVGYQALLNRLGYRVGVDANRELKLASVLLPRSRTEDLHPVTELVALAKNTWSETPQKLMDLVYDFGIDSPMSADHLVEVALKVLDQSKSFDDECVSFNDQIWLPCSLGLLIPRWDTVFVDEVQDLNPCQIYLAQEMTGTRIIAVGDPRQAIYSWRGADRNAMNRLVLETNAKILPLSITYRCPKSVVQLAQRVEPTLEAAPNAEEGSVEHTNLSQMLAAVQAGDYIISRTNAPLMPVCLKLLSRGISARIQGRDVTGQLLRVVNKYRKDKISGFLAWIADYREERRNKLAAKDNWAALEALDDRVRVLTELCRGITTVEALKMRIGSLFSDAHSTDTVVLSTAHRAKGLEADNVYLLDNTFRLGASDEENNIWYVAVTRARKNLRFVV